MHAIRRRIIICGLSAILAANVSVASPAWASPNRSGFNDEYLFATTRGVNDMEVTPALKLPLFPVTIVIDTVLLPFAVIAGLVA